MRSGCVTAELSVSSRPWQSQCVAMSEKNGRSHRRVLGCVVGMTCGHPQTIRLRRRQRSSLSLSKHILTHGCAHIVISYPRKYMQVHADPKQELATQRDAMAQCREQLTSGPRPQPITSMACQ
jgi:hypothetical protein